MSIYELKDIKGTVDPIHIYDVNHHNQPLIIDNGKIYYMYNYSLCCFELKV